MEKNPPRLIVFDLDGTLIDSSVDLCNAVNAALSFSGRPPLPNALIETYIGDGAAMLIRRALGDPGDLDSMHPDGGTSVFPATFEFFLEYYRDHKLDHTRCYDGVIEALQKIRSIEPSLPMAVLSNKPVHPSREICAALGLSPFFFQIYGGNSFEDKKPEPTGLLKLMEEASSLFPGQSLESTPIQPHETVMIGDSDVDIRTARRCGARSIGCTFGLAPAALAASMPDVTVDDPSQWPEALFG
jgi:phosphoglycolate phosphatase